MALTLKLKPKQSILIGHDIIITLGCEGALTVNAPPHVAITRETQGRSVHEDRQVRLLMEHGARCAAASKLVDVTRERDQLRSMVDAMARVT